MIILDPKRVFLTDKEVAGMLHTDPQTVRQLALTHGLPTDWRRRGARHPLVGVCEWVLSQRASDLPQGSEQ